MTTRHADTAAEVILCHPLMRELRPRLESAEEFLAVYRRQATQGYRLLVRWSGETPVALAGYRITENLVHGQHVYVDDLVTSPEHRNQNHGRALLDFLKHEAEALGCSQLVLDSGSNNLGAHHFYQKSGLSPEALHFHIKLS